MTDGGKTFVQPLFLDLGSTGPNQLEIFSDADKAAKIPGLSTYEAPSRIIPITSEDRPLTSTGKVQRSALQEVIQNQIDNA